MVDIQRLRAALPAAVLTAAAAAVFGGCGKGTGGPPPGGGMPPGTPVMAVAAQSRDVPVYIDEIGKTVASETVTISPQVSGKIVDRHFQDGADLHKGDPLFEIDPRPFQAVLDQAQGQLAKDKAAKASADWNVGQDQAALSTKAISEQQLHNDTASRDQSAGAITADMAEIEAAQLNLDYCKMTAPIDGRAGERLVDVGNVVTASGQAAGTNLLVINKLDPIYADFTVTEAELARVQQFMGLGTLAVDVETPADQQMAAAREAAMAAPPPPPGAAPGGHAADDRNDKGAVGLPAAPVAAPFQPRTGKLIFLDNTVQDASGTVKLRAEVANADHHFWPGQFVDVRLVLTNKRAVLVPNIATQVSQQGLFVYKVSADEKSPTKFTATQQPVTVGQRHGAMVVIDSGLAAGDQVVTTGQMMLQPGAPVMVVNAGPPGPVPPTGAPKVGPGTLKTPGSEGAAKTGPSASAAGASAGTTVEGGHS